MQKKSWIFLSSLLIIGICLRVWSGLSSPGWWSDPARDYIVGYHISHFHEFPVLGHNCNGLGNGLYYPPYYFYFVSLLVSIYDSPLFVTACFGLLNALGILVFFLISKELIDETTASIAAVFYTFSSYLITDSSVILSAYLSLPMTLLGCWLVIKGIKNIHPLLNWLGLVTLILSASIFYGNLPVIAVLLCVLSWQHRRQARTALSYLIGTPILFLLLQLPVILFLTPSVYFSNFSLPANIDARKDFFTAGLSILHPTYSIFFSGRWWGAALLLLLFFFVSLCSPMKLKKIAPIIGVIILYFLLAILKSGPYFDHYLLLTYPLYLLLSAAVMSSFFQTTVAHFVLRHLRQPSYLLQPQHFKTSVFGFLSIIAGSSVVLSFLVLITSFISYLHPSYTPYFDDQVFAHVLATHLSTPHSFDVLVNSATDPRIDNPTVWYFLEKELGHHFQVINAFTSITSNTPTPNEYVIACENPRVLDNQTSCRTILQTLNQRYPQYVLEKQFSFEDLFETYIFRNTQPHIPIDLRRFPFEKEQ